MADTKQIASDLFDAVDQHTDKILKDIKTVKGVIKSKSSVTRLTQDYVFQFPIVINADIDNDDKYPIYKCIEKNYASLMMIAITNEGVIDRDKYPNVADFLKRFHNNSDSSFMTSLDNFNLIEAVVTEGYLSKEDITEMWMTATEGLDTTSINDMYQPYQQTAAKLALALDRALEAQRIQALESDNELYFKRIKFERKDGKLIERNGKYVGMSGKDGAPLYEYIPTTNLSKDKIKEYTDKYGAPRTALDWENDKENIDREYREKNFQLQKDRMNSDAVGKVAAAVKRDEKYSEMSPTVLDLTLVNKFKNGNPAPQKLIVGIKAMPRLLPQNVLVSNIADALVQGRPIFKFIQWTKGELKFKDIFFGVTSYRNAAKYGTKWLQVLKKRANKVHAGKLVGSNANPNTTIIITDSDVHMIYQKCGINLEDPKNVQKFMNDYFLLGFGIYDTGAKMFRMIYDGEKEFTDQSIRTIIAENKKDQNLLNMSRY